MKTAENTTAAIGHNRDGQVQAPAASSYPPIPEASSPIREARRILLAQARERLFDRLDVADREAAHALIPDVWRAIERGKAFADYQDRLRLILAVCGKEARR
jgi:hypothetical protein